MKRNKTLILIALIAAFTIALTMIPVQALYSDNGPIMLDSDYFNSHGYTCDTNQHWAKYVLPACANNFNSNSCVNEGPFLFDDESLNWLPPYFSPEGSIVTAVEVKTVSGDYAKFYFNTETGYEEFMIGECTWGIEWINDIGFYLDLSDMAGPCCWHVDWITVWYTGSVIPCESAPEPWVRGDRDMVCYQVWVNDNGCFEFVFFWEYADNNWVKIYDKNGNEVYSIDMPYGDARFEACLPDGMYTVKTYHDDMSEILQEFMIGKPAPDTGM